MATLLQVAGSPGEITGGKCMQRFRTLPIVLAVFAGALTFVAAAPTAPAAAAESFLLAQGDTTLRPSGVWSACQATRGVQPTFQYLRRFHLADYGVPPGKFVLNDLSFGVAKVSKAGFAEVRVYAIDAKDPEMTWGDLELLTTFRPVLDYSDENSVLTVGAGVGIDDASAQDLVLSVGRPDTAQAASFAIGGSHRPETKPSYILAPYCGFDDITNTDVFDIRSDPVIFGSGSTVEPPDTSGEPTRTPADLDGDGYPNADDACPEAYVQPNTWKVEGYEGCYAISVTASAVYAPGSISGFVDASDRYNPTPWLPGTPQEMYEDPCQLPTTVAVWRFEGSDPNPRTWRPTVKLGETISGADGFYSVAVEPLPLGAHYGAVVTSPGVVDGKAYCQGGTYPELLRTVAVPVTRAVEAKFRPGSVIGRVTVTNPPTEAPTACHKGTTFEITENEPPFVRLYASSPDADVEVDQKLAEPDGSFTFDLDPAMPAGTQLFVWTPFMDDEHDGGWCLEAVSAVMTTFTDVDNDEVPDPRDRCPTAEGPDGEPYPGCPTLPQVVTARIDGTTLSGTVTATGAVNGACSQTVVYVGRGGDSTIPVTNLTVNGEVRTYEVDIAHVPDGTLLRVKAEGAFDDGKAICGFGESGLVTAGDGDGDGVLGSLDECPGVPGPSGTFMSGCPYLQQQVSAGYADGAIAGVVSVQRPPGVPAAACALSTLVLVYRITADGREVVAATHTSWDDGSYAVQVGAQADGAQFQVKAFGYPHSLMANCVEGQSEVVEVRVDSDGDGVRDGVDGCDHLDGPGGLTQGCPALHREVTAWHVDGVVSGQVSFVDDDVPASACAQQAHTRMAVYEVAEDDGDLDLLGVGNYSPADGRYSVDLDRDLPVGAGYRVYVLDAIDTDVGWCGLADSGRRTVVASADYDGDGVADSLDSCPAVKGPGDRYPAGCPQLQQQVTAGYANGVVSGVVSVQRPVGVPGTACDGPTNVGVWRITATGRELAGTVETAVDATGNLSYAVQVDAAADQARFQAKAFGYFDTHLALCVAGDSEVVVVQVDGDGDGVNDAADSCPTFEGYVDDPDLAGCPLLERIVSATYADATIKGQIGVSGPNPTPAGTCLSTPVMAFTLVDGVAVQVGETTAPTGDGSYTIAVPAGLADGATYFATVDRTVLDEVAVCRAAESARQQVPDPDPEPDPVVDPVPDPVIAPPGSSGPSITQVAPVISGVKLTKKTIHVVGSRANPRATRLKLSLNVAATVVVKLKGVSRVTGKVTGRQVIAKLAKALPAGASSVKLTGKVGSKKLRPGKYLVTVRATNAVGTATSAASRLTVKP